MALLGIPCLDFLLTSFGGCSKFTTMKKFITIKVWADTLQKLRLVSAHRGKSIVSILDEIITTVLEAEENGRKNHNTKK
jgi:hypothetical protein